MGTVPVSPAPLNAPQSHGGGFLQGCRVPDQNKAVREPCRAAWLSAVLLVADGSLAPIGKQQSS